MDRKTKKNISILNSLINSGNWEKWIKNIYLKKADNYFPFSLSRDKGILTVLKESMIEIRSREEDFIICQETKFSIKSILWNSATSLDNIMRLMKLSDVIFEKNRYTILKEVLEISLYRLVGAKRNNKLSIQSKKNFLNFLADYLMDWKIHLLEYRNPLNNESWLLDKFRKYIDSKNSILRFGYRDNSGDHPYWYYSIVYRLILTNAGHTFILVAWLNTLRELKISKEEYNRRVNLSFSLFEYFYNSTLCSSIELTNEVESALESKGNSIYSKSLSGVIGRHFDVPKTMTEEQNSIEDKVGKAKVIDLNTFKKWNSEIDERSVLHK